MAHSDCINLLLTLQDLVRVTGQHERTEKAENLTEGTTVIVSAIFVNCVTNKDPIQSVGKFKHDIFPCS